MGKIVKYASVYFQVWRDWMKNETGLMLVTTRHGVSRIRKKSMD